MTPEIENLPSSQSVQPSEFEVAAERVEYWPAGHSWSKQLILNPVPDHLPVPQLVQPSVAEVAAAVFDEY